MTFNRELFRAAAAKTTKVGQRDNWQPESKGARLCEVVLFKQHWGKKANFIAELKIHAAPEGCESEVGRTFPIFVKLNDSDLTNQMKDYTRMKSYYAAALGFRGDEEECDDVVDTLLEDMLESITTLVPMKGGKLETKTVEHKGLAKGAILGVNVVPRQMQPDEKTGKYKPEHLDDQGNPKVFINRYPFVVALKDGYDVNPDDLGTAIGADGVVVPRLSVSRG